MGVVCSYSLAPAGLVNRNIALSQKKHWRCIGPFFSIYLRAFLEMSSSGFTYELLTSFAASYVEVSLIHEATTLKKKKTLKKEPNCNPVFNETLTFHIPVGILHQTSIILAVKNDDAKRTEDELIGKILLGPASTGIQFEHWNDMRINNKPVARWHKLLEWQKGVVYITFLSILYWSISSHIVIRWIIGPQCVHIYIYIYICIFLIAAVTAWSTSRKIATGSHRLPNFQNSILYKHGVLREIGRTMEC